VKNMRMYTCLTCAACSMSHCRTHAWCTDRDVYAWREVHERRFTAHVNSCRGHQLIRKQVNTGPVKWVRCVCYLDCP